MRRRNRRRRRAAALTAGLELGFRAWSTRAIFAGDLLRGFDVYRFANCTALGCIDPLGVTFEADLLETVLVDPVTGALA